MTPIMDYDIPNFPEFSQDSDDDDYGEEHTMEFDMFNADAITLKEEETADVWRKHERTISTESMEESVMRARRLSLFGSPSMNTSLVETVDARERGAAVKVEAAVEVSLRSRFMSWKYFLSALLTVAVLAGGSYIATLTSPVNPVMPEMGQPSKDAALGDLDQIKPLGNNMHSVALNLSDIANDLGTEANYLVLYHVTPFLQSIQGDASRAEMWRDVEFLIRWPLEKDYPAQERKHELESIATKSKTVLQFTRDNIKAGWTIEGEAFFNYSFYSFHILRNMLEAVKKRAAAHQIWHIRLGQHCARIHRKYTSPSDGSAFPPWPWGIQDDAIVQRLLRMVDQVEKWADKDYVHALEEEQWATQILREYPHAPSTMYKPEFTEKRVQEGVEWYERELELSARKKMR